MSERSLLRHPAIVPVVSEPDRVARLPETQPVRQQCSTSAVPRWHQHCISALPAQRGAVPVKCQCCTECQDSARTAHALYQCIASTVHAECYCSSTHCQYSTSRRASTAMQHTPSTAPVRYQCSASAVPVVARVGHVALVAWLARSHPAGRLRPKSGRCRPNPSQTSLTWGRKLVNSSQIWPHPGQICQNRATFGVELAPQGGQCGPDSPASGRDRRPKFGPGVDRSWTLSAGFGPMAKARPPQSCRLRHGVAFPHPHEGLGGGQRAGGTSE